MKAAPDALIHGAASANQEHEAINEAINGAINEAINEAIKDSPGINKPKLIKLFGKSRATVERAIAELVSASRIEHRGSNKTGGYYPL